MGLDLRSSELEHSFLKERICTVEKQFSDISLKLSNYNKNLALLRDSGDDFSKSIYQFASKENFNLSLKTSLLEFSDLFAALQDYRDAQIQRIDAKAVKEFSNYDSVCKKAKEELKRCFEARAIELKKQTQLEKLRGKCPTNWQKISQAEKEASIARDEATHTTVEMSQRIDSFEKKKIEDMKHSLLEFIKIEMMFYAKAIELHTNAYNVIKNVKIEEDMHEFRCHFRALRATLDTECLLNPNILRKPIEPKDVPNLNSESTSSSHQDQLKSPFTLKSMSLKLGNSNSSLKTISESKFNFGDQSL